MSDTVDMQAAALELARNGIQVFPVHPGTKKPMVNTGANHAVGASGNSRQIIKWWTKWPGASIGVSMAASNVFVVDVDGPAGYEYLNNLVAEHGELPDTWVAKSGRKDVGFHYWFQQPDYDPVPTLPQTTFGVEHQIEVRGVGSMVVAPPSQHKTGARYQWLGGPDELPEPAPAPQWLLDHLRGLAPAQVDVDTAGNDELAQWVDALEAHGSEVVARGGYLMANCPGPNHEHGDRDPSLSLKVYDDGVGVKCHTGCTYQDITGALFAEIKVPSEDDAPDEAETSDDPIGAAIVDLLVLRDDPTGGTEWLQEPIAVKNANHLFVAGSGVGKSLLWLAVAAYRALGRDPFTGEPCEPLSVLYIDAENPLAAIRDRLENMGIDFAELQATGRFHYASMPDLPPLDTPAGGLAVHKYVAARSIDLVVIDTVSSTTSPDKSENSDEVARGVTQYTTKPLIRAGKAIVRLDHESHKTASSGNGAMGSSAKRRDADIEWRMVKQDGGYKLTREKDRRAFVAHQVHLYLDDNPLRFTFKRTWPTGTFPLAAFLDEHAVPYDWTNKQVRERIAALDYQGPRRNEVVAAAIRYRNENRARIGGERLGNATSFTSGERGGTGVQQP